MAGTENRDLIAQAEALIEVARMPNIEYVADSHNAAVRWIRQYAAELRAQAAQPPAAQPLPAYYVYEWDTAFGVHTDTSAAPWNGMPPDRTVPLYRQPDPRIAEYRALLREVMQRSVVTRELYDRIEAALKEG